MNKQEIEKAIELLKTVKHTEIKYQSALDLAITALTQQLNNGWIPVSTGRLPKNEERVLILANKNRCGLETIQIRATAMYEDGTMHTDDSGYSWEDNDFEYDEETDDYIIPEGWWEQNMYCEEFGSVDDFVIAWQPLPEPYKEDTDAERN